MLFLISTTLCLLIIISLLTYFYFKPFIARNYLLGGNFNPQYKTALTNTSSPYENDVAEMIWQVDDPLKSKSLQMEYPMVYYAKDNSYSATPIPNYIEKGHWNSNLSSNNLIFFKGFNKNSNGLRVPRTISPLFTLAAVIANNSGLINADEAILSSPMKSCPTPVTIPFSVS